jgi:hypothetical protein
MRNKAVVFLHKFHKYISNEIQTNLFTTWGWCVSAAYKYEEEIIMKILFNVDVRNNVTYVSFKDCTIQTQNTVK